MVDGLAQQGSKLLVVEDLEWTARGNLAHSGRVESMVVVAVTTLDKDAAVAQAFSKYLSTNIVQVHTWKDKNKDLFSFKTEDTHAYSLLI